MTEHHLTPAQRRITLQALADFRDVRQDAVDEWVPDPLFRTHAQKQDLVREVKVADRAIAVIDQ